MSEANSNAGVIVDGRTHLEIIQEAFERCGVAFEQIRNEKGQYDYLRLLDVDGRTGGDDDVSFDFNPDGSFNRVDIY